jgi:hypothetical protein
MTPSAFFKVLSSWLRKLGKQRVRVSLSVSCHGHPAKHNLWLSTESHLKTTVPCGILHRLKRDRWEILDAHCSLDDWALITALTCRKPNGWYWCFGSLPDVEKAGRSFHVLESRPRE